TLRRASACVHPRIEKPPITSSAFSIALACGYIAQTQTGITMEYIRVRFDPNDIRDVIASGNVIGQTETELAVQPNYYVISLSGSGYAPPYWYGVVSGTMVGHPLTISFTPV
ncbi:MAG: hypothetical protein WCB44_08040, partial [Stellaceae bacterium]